jgi:hypothetical protein
MEGSPLYPELCTAVPSNVSYRKWHSPTVGQPVTQVWQGYAARLFISFGQLTPSDYTRRDGSPGRPHGKLELTNMSSLSGWRIILNGRRLADSESSPEKEGESAATTSGKAATLAGNRGDLACNDPNVFPKGSRSSRKISQAPENRLHIGRCGYQRKTGYRSSCWVQDIAGERRIGVSNSAAESREIPTQPPNR